MAQIVPGLSDFVDHDDCTQTIADNATDAEARLAALEAATVLTVVAGTNAAVTMLVNRHYELDASILTADRNYTLPTPTATGDRIRVSLTNGNASYECIIKGNTGITVNGGSAGAEWSRLFIAREFAEFRATSATNWDVWDDGRIPQKVFMFLSIGVSSHYANDAVTKSPLDTTTIDVGNIADLANDLARVRRDSSYSISGSSYVDGLTSTTNQIISFLNIAGTNYRGGWIGRGSTGASGAAVSTSIAHISLAAGDEIYTSLYHNDGGARNATVAARFTNLTLVELL